MEHSDNTAPYPELRGKVVEQLQTVHALKAGALRMFGPMLADVHKQRDEQALPEVEDLLENMTSAFGVHEGSTREHERRVRARLRTLGVGPSKRRNLGLSAVVLLHRRLGRIGGQNHGASARDAFVFEHLEIASWELLEHLAERIGDAETAELARECRADDDEMAALIRRNFPNVLSLMLASEGLPTSRESETAGDGEAQHAEASADEGETEDGRDEPQEPEPGVNVQEAARLREEAKALVLDVRDQEEWDAGHIPDALWVPMEEVEARRSELPTARRVVTVCRSGKRSGKVAAQLRDEGHEADNIEGGMEAWHKAGLPMEPPDGHVA